TRRGGGLQPRPPAPLTVPDERPLLPPGPLGGRDVPAPLQFPARHGDGSGRGHRADAARRGASPVYPGAQHRKALRPGHAAAPARAPGLPPPRIPAGPAGGEPGPGPAHPPAPAPGLAGVPGRLSTRGRARSPLLAAPGEPPAPPAPALRPGRP